MQKVEIIVTNALLLVVGLMLFTVLPQQVQSQSFAEEYESYDGPIIDMHLHGYTDDEFWGPVPNPATGEISVKTASEHRQKSIEMPNPSIFLEKFLKGAKERNLLNRVMFGSDQVIWPEAIEMSINRVNQLNFLTLEEKANIFYNNAARFLDLNEDVNARHQQK